MEFFKFLFFWVAGSDAYAKDGLGFHKEFFVNNGGFLYGFLIAALIGLVICAIFYFGMCNNFSLAKVRNWWICLIVTAIATFFVSDLVVIGGNGSKLPTSFYKSNIGWVDVQRKKKVPNIKDYTAKKVKIEQKLKKWSDVRFPFDTTCAIYGIVFYVAISCFAKGYSKYGKKIPF